MQQSTAPQGTGPHTAGPQGPERRPGPNAVPGAGPVTPLTLRERARGKRYYFMYGAFNSISYPVLAEGVVTLVLLRLGGRELWVGATSALLYASLPFMLLGYTTIARLGVTGTAGLFWGLRSLSAGLMIAAPIAARSWGGTWGLWLMFLGSLGFNVGRAAGVVSFTGIITELTTEKDRGDLIASSMRISQVGTLLVTVLMALLLGPRASFFRYQIFFSVGMVSGILAAWALWSIPESGQFRAVERFSLAAQLRWLMETRGRRWFFAMMIVIPITQGVVKAFVVLVAKQGYHLSDQLALLFVIVSVLGGIGASYAYGLFMDKLGSRPLLVLTGFIDMVSMSLLVALPVQPSFPLLALVFLLTGATNIAYQAAMQHYFISMTNRRQQIQLGIVTQSCGGLAAGVALYGGGWILEGLEHVLEGGADPLLKYRWFFGGVLAVMALRTPILFGLPRLRSQNIRDALSALISVGDWRAAAAVKRALTRQSESEEAYALKLLGRSSAPIYQDDIRHYLQSPSYFVRDQAMEGLAHVQPTPLLVQTLMDDLRVNRYLTAHWSAYWLGRWQAREAIPLLEAVMFSKDFLLSARAIHALVDLGAEDLCPLIEVRFTSSDNPLVIIEGARALSLWGGHAAYPLLLEKYALDIPSQAKDELSLSVARLLGLYDALYRDLGMLHRDPEQLSREWRERRPAISAEQFLTAFQGAPQPRARFERAVRERQQDLAEWFAEDTLRALEKQADPMDPSLAFLLAFLLLSRRGEHLRPPPQDRA